jgi:hypothetical protein
MDSLLAIAVVVFGGGLIITLAHILFDKKDHHGH